MFLSVHCVFYVQLLNAVYAVLISICISSHLYLTYFVRLHWLIIILGRGPRLDGSNMMLMVFKPTVMTKKRFKIKVQTQLC